MDRSCEMLVICSTMEQDLSGRVILAIRKMEANVCTLNHFCFLSLNSLVCSVSSMAMVEPRLPKLLAGISKPLFLLMFGCYQSTLLNELGNTFVFRTE